MTEQLGSAQVVVVGGGVIGLSIAYHLATAGVSDVVVVEQAELGSGSTSKCAGGTRTSFSNEANLRMGMRGLEVYSTFSRDFDQEVDFRRNGYLYLITDPTQVPVFEEAIALQRRHGIESSLIDPDEARKLSPILDPSGFSAAVWSPDDGHCSPESVVLGYARAARAAGVKIMRNVEVVDIVTSGSVIAGVVTTKGAISTRNVVCAAGAWSARIGEMAGTKIPIVPVKRRTAFTGALNPRPKPGPLTMDVDTTFWFLSEGPGYLFGWNNADEPIGFDLSFDTERWIEGLVEIADRLAPAVSDFGIASGWSGFYEETPDHNQIIDRSPDVDGLIIAAGFSGHGFQMGPATGEIVRDLFLEKEPGYDIRPFAAGRFDEGTATREAYII